MEFKDLAVAKFTAPYECVIVSDDGSATARFEAGQTRPLPRRLFPAALKAGLVAEGNLKPEPEEEAPPNRSQEEIVEEGLLAACKALIIRGVPEDFTLNGVPRASSIKRYVDFRFNTQQVKRAFEQAMHEVEQDGDESQEHN